MRDFTLWLQVDYLPGEIKMTRLTDVQGAAMKVRIATAALVFAAVPALSQATGVSRPDTTPITSSDDQMVSHPAVKPSATKTMEPTAPTSAAPEVYGAYVPYKPALAAAAVDAPVTDPDAQVVMSVPDVEGQLREGTLLRVKMQQGLSTIDTVRGSKFTAELTEAVTNNGRTVLPVGSVLDGRVTEVHSGKRISGAASLHLEPLGVTLPDGTHYVIHAQLIDTDQLAHMKVAGEGTLERRDHPKETLAIAGATTGAAAIAGGMIGGGVGAVVGAGIGAGVSTVVWLRQDRQAVLPKDSGLIFSLVTPMMLKPLSSGAVSMVSGETTVHGAQ
jgi:hypothetical protein